MTSDHYRFEQVAPHAWAAIAIDSGAAVGNAGIVDLGTAPLSSTAASRPAAARDLRAAAEELAGPVDRLVITHADFDHYGGAQASPTCRFSPPSTTAATIAEVGPGRVAGMQEQMATYLAELEEQDAPEWEKEQGRRIVAEVPGLVLRRRPRRSPGERELGGALVIECGAAHTASDCVVWLPGERVLFTGDLVGVGSPPEPHPRPSAGELAGDPRPARGARARARRPRPRPTGRPGVARRPRAATSRRSSSSPRSPGDHEMPAEYADWAFAEGFQTTSTRCGRDSVRPWRTTGPRPTATGSPTSTTSVRDARSSTPRRRRHARGARRQRPGARACDRHRPARAPARRARPGGARGRRLRGDGREAPREARRRPDPRDDRRFRRRPASRAAYSLIFVVFNTFFALSTQERPGAVLRERRGAPAPDGGSSLIEVFFPDLGRFDRGQVAGDARQIRTRSFARRIEARPGRTAHRAATTS